MTQTANRHVLKKRMPRSKKHYAYWYDRPHNRVIMPDGMIREVNFDRETIEDTLTKIASHAHRNYHTNNVELYFVSGVLVTSRPERSYFESVTSWQIDDMKWGALKVEYTLRDYKISVYGTGKWYGECLDMEAMYKAHSLLQEDLRLAFRGNKNAGMEFCLLPTPTMSGKELIAISLPFNKEYATIDKETADFIHRNYGQARIEHFAPKQEEPFTLYCPDGMWMYASCISNLPIGEYERDSIDKFEKHIPGFYHCNVTVPSNWQHIGLLASDKKVSDLWEYPNTGTFQSWTTYKELELALENGWHIEILERILWRDTDKLTDPLATWRKNLVALRTKYSVKSDIIHRLIKGAIRNILLHTVGSFHATEYKIEHFTPIKDLPLPDCKKEIMKATSKGMQWIEYKPLSGDRLLFSHPEWSAMAWGMARWRLAKFALRLPFESIVSMSTDCVYTSVNPEWIEQENTGKPGSFRLKDEYSNFTWPATWPEMRAWIVKKNKDARNIEVDELLLETKS